MLITQLLVSFLVPVVLATTDVIKLQPNRDYSTCQLITSSNHWIFNERLTPQLTVWVPKGSVAQLDVAIVGGSDLQHIELIHRPVVCVCDRYSYEKGYCTLNNERGSPLTEFIQEKRNSLPVAQAKLSANTEPYTYKVPETNSYCLVLYWDNKHTPEEEWTMVNFEFQTGYGELKEWDYKYLWCTWYFGLAYVATSVLYGLSVSRAITDDAVNSVVMSPDQRKYGLQYKLIVYASLNALIFLSQTVEYACMNRYGYAEASEAHDLLRILYNVANTVLVVWALYNLSLLMIGAYFKLDRPQNTRRKIKTMCIVCIVLGIEMLLSNIRFLPQFSRFLANSGIDTIIYYELVTIFVVLGLYGLYTCRHIQSRTLANKLSLTLVLLTFSFIFDVVLRNINLQRYFLEAYDDIIHSTNIDHSVDLAVFIAIALVWKRVIFKNDYLCIPSDL